MPHLSCRGLGTHYQQAGSAGAPDVVLVHAVTSNLAVWMFIGLLDTLGQEFRVTAYDLRGHGLTETPPDGYTSADLAEDFAALHEALQLGPAYLVGHSFGGVVALEAALRYPDRVKGVIVADSYFPGLAAFEPNLPDASVWLDLRGVFGAAGLELGPRVDFETLFEVVARLTPEQRKVIHKQMGPASARWLAGLPRLADTTCGRDLFAVAGLTAQRICSVTQPVVALYDEYSPFLATCRFLEENLADCTVDMVPGAKHLAPVQNPTGFVERVQKHLRQLRDRASHSSQPLTVHLAAAPPEAP
ncbi:MAG: alpha/beta hydrolase [Gemmataceae bacterium]